MGGGERQLRNEFTFVHCPLDLASVVVLPTSQASAPCLEAEADGCEGDGARKVLLHDLMLFPPPFPRPKERKRKASFMIFKRALKKALTTGLQKFLARPRGKE